jgi:hypothetical protein
MVQPSAMRHNAIQMLMRQFAGRLVKDLHKTERVLEVENTIYMKTIVAYYFICALHLLILL